MRIIKTTASFLAVFIFLSLCAFAQKSDKDKNKSFGKKFSDAEYHILNDNYGLALPIYLDLLQEEPDNANLNYKVGLCYMNTLNEKLKAIPYLEKASANVSDRFQEFEATEKRAPEMAYYYLAKAYHHDYQFDKAIEFFGKFRQFVRDSDMDRINDLEHSIEMCRYGKELVKNPVSMKISNMGDSVNSKYPDYSPALTVDESMIIFTSRREGSTGEKLTDDGQYYEDIYVSHNAGDGWAQAYHIGTNVNTWDHEACISVSADGNIVFIYKGKRGEGDIYYSRLNGDVWSVPEKLGSDINTKYWETHASLSSNGQILYFVSDRPGGFGGRDVYRCVKLPNGEWSKAVNLGPTINTKFDEDGVFIHPNGKDLYFSSNGHRSMGGFDIFKATLSDDGTWSTPENVGYPINSTDDDLYFVVSADNKRAYYSSDHEGGFGEKDIYMIELEVKDAVQLTLLTGKINMFDGSKVPANTITATIESTGEVYAVSKARNNGKYVLTLPPGNNYIITYEVEGFPPHIEKIEVPAGTGYQEIKREIQVNPIGFGTSKEGTTTTGKDVNANTGKDSNGSGDSKSGGNDAAASKDKDPFGLPKANTGSASEAKVKDYSRYFTYNQKDIDVKASDFTQFINYLAGELNAGKVVNLKIDACASKVPTKSFKDNKELARFRGLAAKELLIKELKARGVKNTANLKLTKFNYTVEGPEYMNDAVANKEAYEKFQFIKIYALD